MQIICIGTKDDINKYLCHSKQIVLGMKLHDLMELVLNCLIKTMFVTLAVNNILFVSLAYSPVEAMLIQTNTCCIFLTVELRY
jgi:hypothetical protein